jgi:hypothetical protein
MRSLTLFFFYNNHFFIFYLSSSGKSWYADLKDTNSRLIDYVKSINKNVGTANSGKEFSEITENNKSRKTKEFKSKSETAL